MQELREYNFYEVIAEIIETWILPIKYEQINNGKRTERKPRIHLTIDISL